MAAPGVLAVISGYSLSRVASDLGKQNDTRQAKPGS
jgi:hypothetical protein